MKERPILFSAPMVRGILAGVKTQTRRIATPRRSIEPMTDECPYGQTRDRLWVREAWARDDEDGTLMYRADVGRNSDADLWEQGRLEGVPRYRWRPSIHMPRLASRITLVVTDVRVERLQDITHGDVEAEGIQCEGAPAPGNLQKAKHAVQFIGLWESIHGRGSWDANPWVWVVEFERLTATSPNARVQAGP